MNLESAAIGVLTALIIVLIFVYVTPEIDQSIADANWEHTDGPPQINWVSIGIILGIILIVGFIMWWIPSPAIPYQERKDK